MRRKRPCMEVPLPLRKVRGDTPDRMHVPVAAVEGDRGCLNVQTSERLDINDRSLRYKMANCLEDELRATHGVYEQVFAIII